MNSTDTEIADEEHRLFLIRGAVEGDVFDRQAAAEQREIWITVLDVETQLGQFPLSPFGCARDQPELDCQPSCEDDHPEHTKSNDRPASPLAAPDPCAQCSGAILA